MDFVFVFLARRLVGSNRDAERVAPLLEGPAVARRFVVLFLPGVDQLVANRTADSVPISLVHQRLAHLDCLVARPGFRVETATQRSGHPARDLPVNLVEVNRDARVFGVASDKLLGVGPNLAFEMSIRADEMPAVTDFALGGARSVWLGGARLNWRLGRGRRRGLLGFEVLHHLLDNVVMIFFYHFSHLTPSIDRRDNPIKIPKKCRDEVTRIRESTRE